MLVLGAGAFTFMAMGAARAAAVPYLPPTVVDSPAPAGIGIGFGFGTAVSATAADTGPDACDVGDSGRPNRERDGVVCD